ncbi:hypothetical protein G4B88_026748 [Cannabis sativa]|uniref:F-box domain-containing protein n=1 Tax=Cannabis sativa TaxID=3483 RepID=A0A7J6F953_CANSA|nr:hypothetical protein G4B88_026748 [Cannabis sativa]
MAGTRRKIQKKKKEEEERKEPLDVLGRDIMCLVMSYLDAHTLALSLLVSPLWNALASTNCLWAPKCEELWLQKVHIPRLSQIPGLTKLAAYSLSFMDGKRTRITKYDLSDHVWELHFNKAAPEYWRNLDTYWKGGRPLLRRYFHLDGSQTADPDDPTWGGHESCYCTVTSFIGEEQIREHYVRINRWPKMNVYRKQDWSWNMSNHLYCYSSIPDPHKQGGTGPFFSVV